MEPGGSECCCPDERRLLLLLFGVEVERVDGVIGSSLHDEDEDGIGGPALFPLPDR